MSWTMLDTLLRAGPWEIAPADRSRVEAAAYIERIWLPREEPDPEPIPFVFPEGSGR